MLSIVAYVLALILSLFIIWIGVRFLVQPHAAAAGYGVPVPADANRTYLTVKGLRDGSYGIVGLALIAFAPAHAVAWLMLVVAINPLGDTLVVLRNGGSRAVAFGIHFATAVVVLADAALLFAV